MFSCLVRVRNTCPNLGTPTCHWPTSSCQSVHLRLLGRKRFESVGPHSAPSETPLGRKPHQPASHTIITNPETKPGVRACVVAGGGCSRWWPICGRRVFLILRLKLLSVVGILPLGGLEMVLVGLNSGHGKYPTRRPPEPHEAGRSSSVLLIQERCSHTLCVVTGTQAIHSLFCVDRAQLPASVTAAPGRV